MTARSLAAALVLALVGRTGIRPDHFRTRESSRRSRRSSPRRTSPRSASACDDKDIALGTIVDADGLILTKASELAGAVSVRLPDGTEYEAKVVARTSPPTWPCSRST